MDGSLTFWVIAFPNVSTATTLTTCDAHTAITHHRHTRNTCSTHTAQHTHTTHTLYSQHLQFTHNLTHRNLIDSTLAVDTDTAQHTETSHSQHQQLAYYTTHATIIRAPQYIHIQPYNCERTTVCEWIAPLRVHGTPQHHWVRNIKDTGSARRSFTGHGMNRTA